MGVVLAWLGGLWFRYQVGQLHEEPSAPAPITDAPQDSYPGFQPLRGAWIGAPLFAREDNRAYVGRVTSLSCPSQLPGAFTLVCLEIEFADGRRKWVPWNTVQARFLTPRR